ncbi:MAG TPA: EamA/RhaT family transporter [Bacteroides sp.]|nr:EamA/RhaT family transporter [Bacteroides sp.]
MTYLLLSILSSTGIFLIFRLIDRRDVKTFPVIVINYITASSIGFFFSGDTVRTAWNYPPPFFVLAVIIGILFIVMFFIIARSSQKAGMAVTTIAGKMSVIFPIIFSILYDPGDTISLLKTLGILIALAGVLLTIFKKKNKLPDPSLLYLPLILFVGMGIVDSLVKLAQHEYVSDNNLSLFTALLFGISAISGILVSFTGKNRWLSLFNFRVLGWGVLLGFVNFGSIFFLVRTLNYSHPSHGIIDSSVVFGINNIGIVALSVLLGVLLFREKLSRLNITGIIICIIASIVLAYSS